MTKNNNAIPQGWSVKSLGQIGVFLKGKGIAKTEIVETGKPCIRYGEIYSEYNYFVEEFKSFIDETSAKNSEPIYKNDLLFAGSGETLEDIGKCIAYIKEDEAYAGGDIIILRPNSEDAHFLGYLLNSNEVKKQTFRFGQGHSVVHIYSSSLKHLKVNLPPLPEQQKIAKILATWDKAILLYDAIIEKKVYSKKTLIPQLLTGKKKLIGFNGNWEKIKLGLECDLITKGTTPTSIGESFQNEGINFIKIESIESDGTIIKNKVAFINEKTNELLKRSQLKENDILISIAGALGRVTLINKEILPANTNQALAIVRLKNSSKIDVNYLYYYLNSPKIKKEIDAINVQAAQANLSLENINNLTIEFPDLKEQLVISTILKSMDDEIKLLKLELELIKSQKKGLMQQLLTGIVRVKN